jgi:hypothetical protein
MTPLRTKSGDLPSYISLVASAVAIASTFNPSVSNWHWKYLLTREQTCAIRAHGQSS